MPETFVRETDFRYGRIRYPVNWPAMALALEKFGDFSLGECFAFESILNPGDTAIDIGANLGVFTLVMSKSVGPTGRVLAFEPQPSIFDLLQQNLALNKAANVEPHMRALSSRVGEAFIEVSDLAVEKNMGNAVLRAQASDSNIPVTTVRLDDWQISSCRLIKIDVEGHEADVLNGSIETIERCRPWISTEMDREPVSYTWFEQMKEMGYRFYFYYPLTIAGVNFKNADYKDAPRIISSNMLCAPRPLKDDHVKVPSQLFEITTMTEIKERISDLIHPG